MSNGENLVSRELFLANFEKLSAKIEQLTSEMSFMKGKLDKSNIVNRSFGLKALKKSQPLEFAKDVAGVGSPTKEYKFSIRAISEEWKGRKNDVLIAIRQQEKETHSDIKALGIRIPISDIKNIRVLTQEVLSLLFIACELKGIAINDILRDILQEINNNGKKLISEIKQKMVI